MSNFRAKLEPDNPVIESIDSISKNDPNFKPYFSIHFDKDGKIIGVDAPNQVKIQWVQESKPPLTNIIAVSAVKIIHKLNSSPCCIIHKGRLICWG